MIGVTEAFNKAIGVDPDALAGDDGAGLLAELVKKPAKPAKPAKKVLSGDGMVARDIALSLADKLVNQEAEQHNILADIQGCCFTDGDIPLIVKGFKDKLDAEGYKGAAQRSSDLKIVLIAMMKWGYVSGDGLQASAKQARELAKKMGYIKPRKAKASGEPSNGKAYGVFTMPEEDSESTISAEDFFNCLAQARKFFLAHFDWEELPEAKNLYKMLFEVQERAKAMIGGELT